MEKKILVTGGSGFIGSVVVRKLLDINKEVRVFDRMEPNSMNIDFIEGNILDEMAILNALDSCDRVVHLAAMLGVKNTEDNPFETLEVNLQGTRNLLNCCVKKGIKKVVFSSSSEIYGEPYKVPIKEDDPKKPVSVYGIAKLACEEYLKAFKKKYNLNYSIVRFFNVYGPGQREDFVIPSFIKGALTDGTIKIYGTGEQTRAFIYVDDAAEGVIATLLKKEASSEAFNIGNPSEPISIKNLAEKIIKLSGKHVKIKYIPLENTYRKGDREIINRIPDISKAKEILNWEPKINLEEGLKKVIAYQEKD
jgi:UDP-glucose 4-epimerase